MKKEKNKDQHNTIKCKACGRKLTNPKSIAAGYGPTCLHKHYVNGQKDYAQNLFMIDKDQNRRIASFAIEKLSDNAVLIIDLDDDENKPSVTNSIDEILAQLKIDKHKTKVICRGTDGIYARYNGTWKFAGKTKEEAISSLNIRRKE